MTLAGRTFRTACAALASIVGIAVAATPAQAAPARDCGGWQMSTVVSGLQQLENLASDGAGGFYLSGQSRLYRLDRAGRASVLLDDLPVPRGLQLAGTTLHLVTGRDGVLWQYDTTNGRLTKQATMTVPNGLLRLPDGDLLTTWIGTDLGVPDTGVSRFHHDTAVVQPNWSPVPRSEGLTLSPDGRFVYTDDLFTGQIIRIPLAAPDRWAVVGRVPGLLPGPDDLTMSRAGRLYVTAHLAGAIYQIDPVSGAACAVVTGLPSGWNGPSSVRIARDGAGWALYVTVFDGSVRRLRPPPGIDLEPTRFA